MAPFIVALLVCVAVPAWALQDVAADHRAAIVRYLAASRTLAVITHFALPVAIRDAAVGHWGFDPTSLGVDVILGMEQHVDAGALESDIVAAHARHLSAAVATDVAEFYESPLGRRMLREAIGGLLPSTDPLARQGPGTLDVDDKRAFDAFMQTPAGQSLKAAEAPVTAAVLGITTAVADRAVGAYVRAKGLPNRRIE